MIVSQQAAMREPAAHARLAGAYVYLGKPALPRFVVLPRNACEPDGGAREGSSHWLKPPRGGPEICFSWSRSRADWTPASGEAKRLSFCSDYLAAHGWAYSRPHTMADA